MGNRVKVLRSMKGISQQELAKAVHSTQKRISEIENENIDPTMDEIKALLHVFECSFEELFSKKIDNDNLESTHALIKYVYREDHVDPNFTKLIYGDMGKRASRLKNIVVPRSYVFFHTSIGDKEYITGYFYIETIETDQDKISKLDVAASCDEFVIFGSREKSKILSVPLLFDKALALSLLSLNIAEEDFNDGRSELSVIASKTREHRKLSNTDVKILLNKCEHRG
jgi:transcriptional regulator with XRE-family HTH domain